VNAAWPVHAAAALAWTLYLPLGAKYAAWLIAVTAGVTLAQQGSRWPDVRQRPEFWPLALLLAWMGLSTLWSPAPAVEQASHLALLGLWLSVPLLAAALPAAAVRLALEHFCAASGLVALLLVINHLQDLPASWLWHSTVQAKGNQRIVNSLLLSIAAVLAMWFATQSTRTAGRAAWIGLAALTALGLALQDRRSGMLTLPLLLLVLALASQPDTRRRLGLALLVAVAASLAWLAADGVRARFAEGLLELRQYESSDAVATSWGQRVRMVEVTLQMVRERPLLGHGVGSWELLWQQRISPGTLLHGNNTPHNDYLLLAQQGGLVALLAWLACVLAAVQAAVRAGPAGVPALLVWTSLAFAALFNAALRDAKMAVPLMLLAAAATALHREAREPQR
jgi:O-antigen ligase